MSKKDECLDFVRRIRYDLDDVESKLDEIGEHAAGGDIRSLVEDARTKLRQLADTIESWH